MSEPTYIDVKTLSKDCSFPRLRWYKGRKYSVLCYAPAESYVKDPVSGTFHYRCREHRGMLNGKRLPAFYVIEYPVLDLRRGPFTWAAWKVRKYGVVKLHRATFIATSSALCALAASLVRHAPPYFYWTFDSIRAAAIICAVPMVLLSYLEANIVIQTFPSDS